MDTPTVIAIFSASGVAALVTGGVTIVQGRLHNRDQTKLGEQLHSQQNRLEEQRNQHDREMRKLQDAHEDEMKRLEYDLLSRAPRAERFRKLLAPVMSGTVVLRRAAEDLRTQGRDLDLAALGEAGRRGLQSIEGVRSELMLEAGCEGVLQLFDTGALRYFAFFAHDVEAQRRMVAERQPGAVEADKHARSSYEDLLGQLEGLERAARELVASVESPNG